MPFKANAARRHHIPKQRHKIQNWAEYDAALHQRGSLTVWFTDAAIAAWEAEPRTTPGGQVYYSADEQVEEVRRRRANPSRKFVSLEDARERFRKLGA